MRTLEEIIADRKQISEEMKTLHEKDMELYRELRELEKKEFKNFEGSFIKIGDKALMYVRRQNLTNDGVELRGLLYSVNDNIRRSYSESDELNGRGTIALTVTIDDPLIIPLNEFQERTTGSEKDIIEMNYNEFYQAQEEMYNNFNVNMGLWTWLNLTCTYRD